MNKLFALYVNEMIKTLRKLSVVLILSITLVAMIGFGVLMRFTLQAASDYRSSDISGEDIKENNRQYIDSLIEMNGKKFFALQEQIDALPEGADTSSLLIEKERLDEDTARLTFYRENDILLDDRLDFRFEAREKLSSLKIDRFTLNQKPQLNEEESGKLAALDQKIAELNDIIGRSDFPAYINLLKRDIDADAALSSEDKTLEKELLDLRVQMLPDPLPPISAKYRSYGYNLETALSYLRTLKTSLKDDVDYRSPGSLIRPLDSKGRAQIQNDLAAAVYKVKNGIPLSNALDSDNASYITLKGLMGIGTFGAVILLIMLGGGAISSEITSGSIKSLIVAPVRRWKIVTAKLIALVTVWIASFLLIYAASIAVNGLMYGFEPGSSFVYAVGGRAHEIRYYLYHFVYLLLSFVPIFVYFVFAFMLSAVTRNTAASVGISMGVYFAGSIVTTFLMQFKARWADFLPFVHMQLADRLLMDSYTNYSAGSILGGFNLASDLPVLFSVIYLIVMLFCMLYTAYDSFCRRDIK